MYSIFLVDDEELELEMMRDYIRWEEMGLYVAGTAVNGRDAVEKIEAIQPDIVLTDVQMPLMNGLDLARHIRERYDWMQLVFLTGHDEFEYVKSALNVGAVGYLLKPLDLSEIVSVIEKVKHQCEEVRMKNRSIRVTRSHILKELVHESDAERTGNLAASFRRLSRHPEGQKYALAMLQLDGISAEAQSVSVEDGRDQVSELIGEWLAEKRIDADIVLFKEGEMGLLMDAAAKPGEYGWNDLLERVRQSLHFTVTIATAPQEESLTGIQALYRQTRVILAELFYTGKGKVIGPEDVQQSKGGETPVLAEKEWIEALDGHDLNRAGEILSEQIAKLVAQRVAKNEVCGAAIGWIEHLLEHIHEPIAESHKRAELYHTVYGCQTIYEIGALVMDYAKQAADSVRQRFADKNAKLVHQVRTMIDQNFHQPITINSLSDQVYLSPNYLRSIFKEKTGMTIHDYLTQIRLDKAKSYLADESLKVQDIAQMVGYESTSYFISLFVKNQGVTPNEYRKHLLLG